MTPVLPEARLLNAEEAAFATGLPIYLFTNKRVREAAGVPFVYINGSIRYDVNAVMNWARVRSAELNNHALQAPVDTNVQSQTPQQPLTKLTTQVNAQK